MGGDEHMSCISEVEGDDIKNLKTTGLPRNADGSISSLNKQ